MFDVIEYLIRYDEGDLDKDEFIALFQYLIDTGMAWSLQGSIGRTAAALIENGLCHAAALTDCQSD